MEITKSIATAYQINATIWRLGNIKIDFANRRAAAVVFGYETKEKATAGAEPLGKIQFDFGDATWPADPKDTETQVLTKIISAIQADDRLK